MRHAVSSIIVAAALHITACAGDVTTSEPSGGERGAGGAEGGTGGSGASSGTVNDPACPAEVPPGFGSAPCPGVPHDIVCYYDAGICVEGWVCAEWENNWYVWSRSEEATQCDPPWVVDCEAAQDGDACPYVGSSCGGSHCDAFSMTCEDHVWKREDLPCPDDCDGC